MCEAVLLKEKTNCCGCGACQNACPKSAITMNEDSDGFLYPFIVRGKCIKCGMCNQVCSFQATVPKTHSISAYAAASKDDRVLEKAASGGIFTVLAQAVLAKGGVVFGSVMEFSNGLPQVRHVIARSYKDLDGLMGSKYVQSRIGDCFRQVKHELENGKCVLFSGTPCQIAGLHAFLAKPHSYLLTVDIICHGVPSERFFQDYIVHMTKMYHANICEYIFRDKKIGQGMTAKITLLDSFGQKRIKHIDGNRTSYYSMFLQGETYRPSCYICPFASEERTSDITLGDYWGVYSEHGRELKNSHMNNTNGISCVLVNTEKGHAFFRAIHDKLYLINSSYLQIAAHNAQLRTPSTLPVTRNKILELYSQCGYVEVERYFQNRNRIKKYVHMLHYYTPKSVKRTLAFILSELKRVFS